MLIEKCEDLNCSVTLATMFFVLVQSCGVLTLIRMAKDENDPVLFEG
jgi:hypothetical protein